MKWICRRRTSRIISATWVWSSIVWILIKWIICIGSFITPRISLITVSAAWVTARCLIITRIVVSSWWITCGPSIRPCILKWRNRLIRSTCVLICSSYWLSVWMIRLLLGAAIVRLVSCVAITIGIRSVWIWWRCIWICISIIFLWYICGPYTRWIWEISILRGAIICPLSCPWCSFRASGWRNIWGCIALACIKGLMFLEQTVIQWSYGFSIATLVHHVLNILFKAQWSKVTSLTFMPPIQQIGRRTRSQNKYGSPVKERRDEADKQSFKTRLFWV